VSQLAADLKARAAEKRSLLADLLRGLRPRLEGLGLPATASRLITIHSAQSLVSDLIGATNPLATIEALAAAALQTSEAAVSRLLAAAEDLLGAFSSTSWDIIEAAMGLTDHRRAAAEALRERLAEALEADEHAVALKPVLRDVQARATRLLAETRPNVGKPPPSAPSSPPPPLRPGEEVLEERPQTVLDAAQAIQTIDKLRDRLTAEPTSKLAISWRLTRPSPGEHG
jgi:hypothetical protein